MLSGNEAIDRGAYEAGVTVHKEEVSRPELSVIKPKQKKGTP